jgi:hypothetical protein
MKAIKLFSVISVLGAILVFSSCTDKITSTVDNPVTDALTSDLKSTTLPVACILTGTIQDVPVSACVVTGTVNEAETAGLLFMREEEKMARDVYTYLYGKYKLPVFLNLSKSENAHMSAVLRLITAFNITDNSTNDPGVYTNTRIAELYLQLIEMGNVSLIDALKVGVLIEQTDISDLQKELLPVENTSVKTVYTNLTAGSNAHLKAFVYNLKIQGVTYP